MKLARPKRQRRVEPIVALIDVVFFLLVFFLLIGRMDATAPFEVSPAFSVSGRSMPGGGATVSIAADGRLALDGRPSDPAAAIAAIRLRAGAEPDLLVRINAHRDAMLRGLIPLVGEIRAAGAADVVLVVTPEAAPP